GCARTRPAPRARRGSASAARKHGRRQARPLRTAPDTGLGRDFGIPLWLPRRRAVAARPQPDIAHATLVLLVGADLGQARHNRQFRASEANGARAPRALSMAQTVPDFKGALHSTDPSRPQPHLGHGAELA